jgi:hypothetical protein
MAIAVLETSRKHIVVLLSQQVIISSMEGT